jgi:hypothetical protein
VPGNHAPSLLYQLPWRGHPLHCAMLCGMVSNNPAALCHPLPYGRRAAPSRKNSGALEGKVNSYATPVQERRRDTRALCDHPRRSRRHPGHCIAIPDAVEACGNGTPPCQLLYPHTASRHQHLESSHGRSSNRKPLHRHPRSRSWARTGRAMTPRQRQDSPGRPSTPRRCAPCLYT